jgi:CPA2 family monovalent cation:H+ antiporter-2
MPLEVTDPDVADLLVELGVVLIALGLIGRIAAHLRISPIPFYLLVGLLLGEGGVIPLEVPTEFVEIGAEIGVLLLLFMLGLEYTGEELAAGVRSSLPAGILDLVLNMVPGFLFGLLLGWSWLGAFLLGGVTYISSSGVVAKLVGDLGWMGNRETPTILSILVIEDLAMAAYLPIIAVLLSGQGPGRAVVTLAVAIIAVLVALTGALRYGHHVSRAVSGSNDETLLLTLLGIILVVAGFASEVQASSAIGAFLVGIAISGEVADRARGMVDPLRDLFAAIFFLFFSLQIDASTLPPVLFPAIGLAVLTSVTKVLTGHEAARRAGVGSRGRWRAGTALIARGEFSIVIAGLGVGAGIEADLGVMAAAYVLTTAILGPLAARFVGPLLTARERRVAFGPT